MSDSPQVTAGRSHSKIILCSIDAARKEAFPQKETRYGYR